MQLSILHDVLYFYIFASYTIQSCVHFSGFLGEGKGIKTVDFCSKRFIY